jgi:hypothetical protein
MLKPPCDRKCPNRHAGCHSRCKEYQEYAAVVAEARNRRNEFKQQEAMLYGRRRR